VVVYRVWRDPHHLKMMAECLAQGLFWQRGEVGIFWSIHLFREKGDSLFVRILFNEEELRGIEQGPD
jgi:hypothetical protein